MTAPMSKLEYLKKYMSSSEKKEEVKVKKKKLKPLLKSKGGIRIIDEEIDLKKIAAGFEKDEDQLDTQEDAPAVAGVIDDRPDDIITKQDFVESSKWKRLEPREDPSLSKSKSSTKKPKVHRNSPPRRTRHDSDSDQSPPRKRHDSDSDPSPPRRHDSDSDQSPPRKRGAASDSDQSPPRKRGAASDSDQSPPRKGRAAASDSDQSPPRKKNLADSDGDLSPVRAGKKMTKTLDGKRAGLQTGRSLREETEELKRREEEAFRKMDKSLTGQNAKTAIRAGKLRQMEAQQAAEAEKAAKIAKLQESYSKWNKGLKQGADQSKKLEEDVHEMSKPLARFAGDDDLEQMLREQDRDGDPMAAYMAKKKRESSGKGPAKPVYRGPADAPNRFGILPGYRWDGVDRSNGYEKMYFEKQNNSVAIQEEAYKWSVSDM